MQVKGPEQTAGTKSNRCFSNVLRAMAEKLEDIMKHTVCCEKCFLKMREQSYHKLMTRLGQVNLGKANYIYLATSVLNKIGKRFSATTFALKDALQHKIVWRGGENSSQR